MDSDLSSSESDFSSDSELEDIASAVVSAMKTELSEKKDKQTRPRSTPSRRRSARIKGKIEHNTVDAIDQSVNFTIDKTGLKTEDCETASRPVTDSNQTVFDLSNVDFGRAANITPADKLIQTTSEDSDCDESNDEEEIVPSASRSSRMSAESSRTFEDNSSDSENEFTFVLDRKPRGSSSLSGQRTESDAAVETSSNRSGRDDRIMTTSEVQLSKDDKRKGRKKKKKKGKSEKKKGDLSTSLQIEGTDEFYVNFQPITEPAHQHQTVKEKVSTTSKPKELEIMKKCVIPDDIEKMTIIPTTQDSLRKQKRERKLEREKTKGSRWFDMPATEMTDSHKTDLEILKMRKALDPKRFYKNDDMAGLPKYFQFGRIVESAADFYHSRVPKKQRKATLAEELLADMEFRKYNKRKYAEVLEAKRQGKGPYNHLKRLKKRKK